MYKRGINEVRLVGHLGADPEEKPLAEGRKLVRISIATSEHWKDKATGEDRSHTEWHDVTLFNQPADYAASYAKKGDLVSVLAKLRSRRVAQDDGSVRIFRDVVAEDFQILSSAAKAAGGRPSAAPAASSAQPRAAAQSRPAPTNPAADNVGWDDTIPT